MENVTTQPIQTVQPLQPTPPIQPVIIPEKPKANYWMITSIILVVAIIAYFAYTVLSTNDISLNRNKLKQTENVTTQTQNQIDENSFSDNVLAIKNNKLFLVNTTSRESKEFNFDGSLDNGGSLYSYGSTYSPDKKWALLIKDNNIWKVNKNLSEQKQLTTAGVDKTNNLWGVVASWPKWSSDGKHIYYRVVIDVPGTDAVFPGMKTPTNIQEGIWVMDQDGGNQKYLPQVKQPIGWMPNNDEIIFNLDGVDTPIKAFNVNKNTTRSLISGNNISDLIEDISWSNDGKVAIYTAKNGNGSYLINDKFELIDHLPRQTGNAPSNVLNSDYTLEFSESHLMSADGKYALITKLVRPYHNGNAAESSYDFDHKVEVFLWSTETKQKLKLPIYFSMHTKPFWTPDSSGLVYVRQSPVEGSTSVSGEQGDIFMYKLDDKSESQITNTKDFDPFNIEF